MHHVLSANMLQAGACGVSLQMGRHASEAADSTSSEASHSRRTGNVGLTDIWLQHAWKLPASPHLAVAAEGMLMPSAQNRHCIKEGCGPHCTLYFFCRQHRTASLPRTMYKLCS